MQRAMIINDSMSDLDELNDLLKYDEWKVIHTCAMPSSASSASIPSASSTTYVTSSAPSFAPTCLVILERK